MRNIFWLLILFGCSGNNKHETVAPADTSVISKAQNIVDTLPVSTAEDLCVRTPAGKIILKEVPVLLSTGEQFNLKIPLDYRLAVAAEGMHRLRFLAMSPDKRLFATDMYDKSDNRKGRVLIFENWNDSFMRFERITTYLDHLHNPNQVAFYNNYLYVAETDKLTRFAYHAGDSLPADTGEIIARFPAYGLSYKYGGWHLTRSIAFHHDKLYVSVGSSCNACVEEEEIRAAILEMDPDGSNSIVFARGTRNSVGIKWIGDTLWATSMGRDLIGPDKPEDVFEKIQRDGFYGWPYYFHYRQKIIEDAQFKDSARPAWVKPPPVPFCGFKAHSAPLGFEYFNKFRDPALQNSVLVCLHGSTSVWRQRGNAVVRIGAGNNYTEVVSGFLTGKTEADRHGRPCDVLMKDDHSFFVTDDLNGVLYYIWKEN